MVWAPHHSYSSHWLNFGTFTKMHKEMLHFAETNHDVDIVMRPHPFLFGTLAERGVVNKVELEDWLFAWTALPNTSIETAGDFATLFKSCDLLLSDGISFIGEYPLVANRPGVFLENEDHWQFSPIGDIAVEANWRIQSFTEFADRFDEIREHGLGDYSAQIERLRQAASPYPGEAAERIIGVIAADFEAATPLVDKASIAELAWEFGPDKEPLVD
jgi:hypothetical protein